MNECILVVDDDPAIVGAIAIALDNSLSEISIGEKKLYIFKDNYA